MPNASRAEYIKLLIPILRSHQAFTPFSDKEIERFADGAEFRFYEQGARLIEQGDEGHEFFVVMSGQLRAVDTNHDPPRLLNYHTPSDIIGTRALFNNEPRSATVEVVIDALVAVFSRDDWEWLLHYQPRIETHFQGLEREFERRSSTDFPGRQWDEVVVTSTKRHILAFFARLTLPLTILIAPLVFLIGVELLGITFLPITTGSLFFTILATLPFFIISALLIIYHYVDWRNDDFIVTTKRFIHIERKLLYGEERDEAPLTRIQDVTLSYPGFLDRFDYYNLEIKTAGAGDIWVNGITNATKMKDEIFQEKERALERVQAANMAAIRHLLAKQLNWEEALEEPLLAIEEVEGGITTEKPRRLPGLLNYLWPQLKEVDEDGTTILWRKHYWVLLSNIALPLLFLLPVFFIFIASLFGLFPFGASAGLLIQAILGIVVLVCLIWYLWRYDGWRRDTYLVTETRIVDVASSPFRLRGESRSEGTLDDIQNITYDIPDFFSSMLNMGTVIIETAGSAETFTFKKVFNPSAIQQEIFNRMVMVQQRERQRKRDATTKELLRLIGEYQNLLEKASAKGIIGFGQMPEEQG
jgi:membrane protein YdbS with pleckstrin-like domain